MSQHELATLAGGCFWCLEAVYDEMEGVLSVESGYMGGHEKDPTYDEVCGGETGHAEVVQVTFDPAVTTYRDLLEVFFTIHDPTTMNRQGSDVGTQYRSAIFHHSEAQRETAAAVIDEFTREKVFDAPIVTELAPAGVFYVAEGYHQEYFTRNRMQPYCMFVVAPKLAKFRAKHASKRKKSA